MNKDLLRIDVDAEIRKLTRQRFKTVGDYAVELIKYVASCRPLLIDIEITSRHFKLTHDGRDFSMASLKRLIAIFDEDRSAANRHNALVELEKGDGFRLLAAFSVETARVSFSGRVDGRTRGLEFSPSKGARNFDASRQEDSRIVVRGRGRKLKLEKRLIVEACKYSIVPIWLNGERINHGPRIEQHLLDVDIRNARLHGTVGLPYKSDLTRIVQLKNGIREEEKVRSPVNGMVFHAIIDEKTDDFSASWATLRRASRRLYARLTRHFTQLGDKEKTRALELLFDRYKHTREQKLLKNVAAFRMVGAAPLDLEAVARKSVDARLFAIHPSESLQRYDLEGRKVLRIDAAQRAFLEDEIGVELFPPPTRYGRFGIFETIKSRLRDLKKKIGHALSGGPGKPVRAAHLEPPEGRFLEAVSAEVRSGGFSLAGEARPFEIKVRMADAQRRPWAEVKRGDSRSEYRISRNHPLVMDMIEAVERNPSYIYPALVLLTEGRDGYVDTREVHQHVILSRHGID